MLRFKRGCLKRSVPDPSIQAFQWKANLYININFVYRISLCAV
jgi:hypothetical protein